MMEMPTPCPTCDRIVELDEMNPCDKCGELYCNTCLSRPWGNCISCKEAND